MKSIALCLLMEGFRGMSMIEEIEKETEWMIKRQAELVTYSKKDAHRSLRYKAKAPERIAALVEYVRADQGMCNKFCLCEPQGACGDRFRAARAKLGLK